MIDTETDTTDRSEKRRERILELREKLLKAASALPPENPKRQLFERVIRNSEEAEKIPEEHVIALQEIKYRPAPQPACIMRLNQLERERAQAAGKIPVEWRVSEPDDEGTPPPSRTLH